MLLSYAKARWSTDDAQPGNRGAADCTEPIQLASRNQPALSPDEELFADTQPKVRLPVALPGAEHGGDDFSVDLKAKPSFCLSSFLCINCYPEFVSQFLMVTCLMQSNMSLVLPLMSLSTPLLQQQPALGIFSLVDLGSPLVAGASKHLKETFGSFSKVVCGCCSSHQGFLQWCSCKQAV